ncbi:MAG: carbohydrate-binding protein [Prolixibacteraceae bacterium]|nr:carbohydrate-binding protein [Prolixibacteraceae bacterium]
MKHLFSIFLIILLPLLTLSAQQVEGFLHADGTRILDGKGENYLLRGIGTGNWMLMEGYMMKTGGIAGTQHEWRALLSDIVGEEKTNTFFDAWLANHFTKTDVDSMRAWGFNSVRVAMHYLWFTPPIEDEPVQGEITWLDNGFNMIDELLDWCEANEMYLILDMHGTPGGQGKNADISDYDPKKPSLWESKDNQDKLTALWYKLAERYKDEPWIGGYDLINETNWDFENNPDDDSGWSNTRNIPLLNMHKRLIDTIRTIDTNHMVFVSGNSWGNNYSGMDELGTYDDNLAYTFHKYWNTNNENDLDWIIDRSVRLNVPLWMSESGENSNTWFTDAIALFETNNIGWSWWPVKKGGINNVLQVDFNESYDNLVKYWRGETNKKPTSDEAFEAVIQLAENHKIENCHVQYDVIDAMIRQPHTNETKPFAKHTVGKPIFAADYDLGKNGFAYFDVDVADYHVSGQDYTAWNTGWAYRNDGVDIETCNDVLSNGYSVGWTNKGEWLSYTIKVDSTAAYDLKLRYAASGSGGKFHFELNGIHVTPVITLSATGGWSTWADYLVEDVVLEEGTHQLKLYIDNAGFNINYFVLENPKALSQLTPDFVHLTTDGTGEELILMTNLGLDSLSVPELSDFELKINGSPANIVGITMDPANSKIIRLTTDNGFIQRDRLVLSYNGKNLKTPDQREYAAFSNRIVENVSQAYVVLPAKIQAEDFLVNQGFQTEDCSDTGGGLNLAYANPGDFADYPVYVEEAGNFVIDYRVASNNSGRFKMQLLKDGELTDLHTITVSTGGWQSWKTNSASAALPQGKITLRLQALSGEYNLNWFQVKKDTGTGNEFLKERKPYFSWTADSKALVLHQQSGLSGTAKVLVYDLTGRQQISRNLQLNGNSWQVIENILLCPGMYLVRFQHAETQLVQKLWIE